MFGEETAEEGEGEVGQRYREQHAACPTVKRDDRLFVAVSRRLAGHTIFRAGHNWRFSRVQL
jgi:hypothetical protein